MLTSQPGSAPAPLAQPTGTPVPVDPRASNMGFANTRHSQRAGASVGSLVIGVVQRVFPAFNSMDVMLASDGLATSCMFASGLASTVFGVKDASMPSEGSFVLVWRSGALSLAVCAVPPNVGRMAMSDKGAPVKVCTPGDNEEQMLAAFGLSSICKVAQDPKVPGRLLGDMSAPHGMLAGEWAEYGDFGTMVYVKHLSAGIRASPLAKMECHALDDFVRIVSAGRYEHVSPGGYDIAFDDGGYCSRERVVCPVWHELLGSDQPEKAFTSAPVSNEQTRKGKFQWSDKGRGPKPRMLMFEGATADLMTMFTQNTRAEPGPWKWDAPKKTPGLSRLSLGGDGSLFGTFAGGIHLQRGDCIPVPKRLRAPWDPQGDKLDENKEMHEPKKPFKWPTQAPEVHARALFAADEAAWRSKQLYQRFDELKKDFDVPQESDVKPQEKIYDPLKSESQLDEQENKNRKCGVRFELNGSVIIYDAFGGEICMDARGITFATAGDITQMPGGHSVFLADDIVLKARKSVDITANENDVRIAAKKNLHVYSKEGGILFQSDTESKGFGFQDEESKGEDARSYGILFKCGKGSVGMIADAIHARFKTKAALRGEPGSSTVTVVAKSCQIALESTFRVLVAKGSSLLSVGERSAVMASRAVHLAAKSSLGLFKGVKLPVLQWVPGEESVYDRLSGAFTAVYSIVTNPELAAPLTEKLAKAARFTFRSARQCGTDKGRERNLPSPTFALIQPTWAFLKDKGYKLLAACQLKEWKEWDAEGTYPWPGEEARSDALKTMGEWKNVDVADMKSKSREGLSEEPGTLSSKSMDDYKILR
jgi:hypothetical protein